MAGTLRRFQKPLWPLASYDGDVLASERFWDGTVRPTNTIEGHEIFLPHAFLLVLGFCLDLRQNHFASAAAGPIHVVGAVSLQLVLIRADALLRTCLFFFKKIAKEFHKFARPLGELSAASRPPSKVQKLQVAPWSTWAGFPGAPRLKQHPRLVQYLFLRTKSGGSFCKASFNAGDAARCSWFSAVLIRARPADVAKALLNFSRLHHMDFSPS